MIHSPYPIIITSNNLYCTFSYKTFFFQCQLLSIPPISPHTGTSLTFSQLSFPSHIFHLPQTSQQYTPYTLIPHSIPSFPTTSLLHNLKSISPNSSLHYIHCNPPYLPTSYYTILSTPLLIPSLHPSNTSLHNMYSLHLYAPTPASLTVEEHPWIPNPHSSPTVEEHPWIPNPIAPHNTPFKNHHSNRTYITLNYLHYLIPYT